MNNSLLPVDQMVPGANLTAYVQAVSSIPVLSPERERELAEDLYYNDNPVSYTHLRAHET